MLLFSIVRFGVVTSSKAKVGRVQGSRETFLISDIHVDIQNGLVVFSFCKMSLRCDLAPQLEPKVPVHLVSVLHPFDHQDLVLRFSPQHLTCLAQEILLVSSLLYNRYAKDCSLVEPNTRTARLLACSFR